MCDPYELPKEFAPELHETKIELDPFEEYEEDEEDEDDDEGSYHDPDEEWQAWEDGPPYYQRCRN